MSAKEDKKTFLRYGGKRLDCYRGKTRMGTVRITVRTHRQSSPGFSNVPARSLKGNPFIGDEKETAGKAYLTVSRKVYVPCRH